jgi:hypothetical protein
MRLDMRYRSIKHLFLAGLVLCIHGCDSVPQVQNEEAAALFVGTWPMRSLTDDQMEIDAETSDLFESIVFKFRVNYTFELEIQSEDESKNRRLTGDFVISKDAFVIKLNSSVEGVGKVPLNFAFEFSGEGAPGDGGPNQLKLITEGETVDSLNLILGTQLIGVVVSTYVITSRLT